VGDVRNIVTAPNRDYIVSRDDEAALADAIRTLAIDSKLRSSIGEANRGRAYAEFGEATMVARYQQLYGSAMGRADFARQD
jgi:L-malate glycosyltransferase